MTTLVQALSTLIADDPSPSRRAILKEASETVATQAAQIEALTKALEAVQDHFDGKLPPKEWVETERLVRATLAKAKGYDK